MTTARKVFSVTPFGHAHASTFHRGTVFSFPRVVQSRVTDLSTIFFRCCAIQPRSSSNTVSFAPPLELIQSNGRNVADINLGTIADNPGARKRVCLRNAFIPWIVLLMSELETQKGQGSGIEQGQDLWFWPQGAKSTRQRESKARI